MIFLQALTSPARRYAAGALVVFAAGCATPQPPDRTPITEAARGCAPAPCPVCPVCPSVSQPTQPEPAEPVMVMSSWETLPGWLDDDPAAAWPAFRESCRVLVRQPAWKSSCEAALALGPRPSSQVARQFFEAQFTPWQSMNADRSDSGLVTGYYEPLIKGSRTRSAQSPWPIHAPPEDMLTIDLASVYPELKPLRLRGRIVGNKVVPYWTRAELEQQQGLPAKVLFWASDPIDLFFLQVQGSGRVELPDGDQVRIGYADQNGHPYQSIGRWLVAKGELPLEKASMEGIKQWARDNPARLPEMLNSNPSYVFFRELPKSSGGPIGALGVPLSEARSIAVDPAHIPLGAPVFLATTLPLSTQTLNRLVLAQDTGGAIKGPVRADFFWGFGSKAGAQAGKMRQAGRMWVLLPRGMNPPGR